MSLTKREAKVLRHLHRCAMDASKLYYTGTRDKTDEMLMRSADGNFTRAVNTLCADTKPVTIVAPVMATDLIKKGRKR